MFTSFSNVNREREKEVGVINNSKIGVGAA